MMDDSEVELVLVFVVICCKSQGLSNACPEPNGLYQYCRGKKPTGDDLEAEPADIYDVIFHKIQALSNSRPFHHIPYLYCHIK